MVNLERGNRIELSALAWKAKVLPLYEPRINSGVGDRDRTCIKRICNPRPDHSATHLHIALHPPAVIIVQKDMTLSYPSLVPSTRFPTGTVLALLAAFRFKDYHPYMSLYFSSCGSHYPETNPERSGGECGIRTQATITG